MHPILVGVISLGSFEIPVKVYSAKQDRDTHSVQLCAKCQTPIQLRRWCPTCGAELEHSLIVKGFRQGSTYVVRPEEGAETGDKPDRRIVVTSFIHLSEIDPLYVEKSYFLEPVKPEVKAFRLLKRALEVSGRAALGEATLRSREAPILLRSRGKTMVMHTLTRPEEIRRASTLEVATGRVGARELDLMLDFIQRTTLPFLTALAKKCPASTHGSVIVRP